MADAPITPKFKALMNGLAETLDTLFNGKRTAIQKPENGFILFVFPFNEPEKRANYISNCNREDSLSFIKEWVARCEGKTLHEEHKTAQ